MPRCRWIGILMVLSAVVGLYAWYGPLPDIPTSSGGPPMARLVSGGHPPSPAVAEFHLQRNFGMTGIRRPMGRLLEKSRMPGTVFPIFEPLPAIVFLVDAICFADDEPPAYFRWVAGGLTVRAGPIAA